MKHWELAFCSWGFLQWRGNGSYDCWGIGADDSIRERPSLESCWNAASSIPVYSVSLLPSIRGVSRRARVPAIILFSLFVRFTLQKHPAISNFAIATMNHDHRSPWASWASTPSESSSILCSPGNPFAKSSNPSLFRGSRNPEAPFRDTRWFFGCSDYG